MYSSIFNILQICTTITTINFKTLSLPPKETMNPLTVNPTFPHASSPRQLLIYFLSVIHLFWMLHISGIIQYAAFCDWLLSFSIIFSRSIHVLARVNTLWLNTIPLFGYTIFYLSFHQLFPLLDCYE